MSDKSILTDDEQKWINRLQKVLKDCPTNRLGFYTIGDNYIEIYDLNKEEEIDSLFDSGSSQCYDFCQVVDHFYAQLGSIKFPNRVHSTAG